MVGITVLATGMGHFRHCFQLVKSKHTFITTIILYHHFSNRLNFDYEMRRPTEQGPWPDHIPIDGRDIWRFILIADDSRSNIWRADPASFVNLGQDQRNRCWPWSDGDVLPFERQSAVMVFKFVD